MTTAATARGRKTRKAGAPTPALTKYISSNAVTDSSDVLRFQFLTTRLGMDPVRAPLVAALAWEEARG